MPRAPGLARGFAGRVVGAGARVEAGPHPGLGEPSETPLDSASRAGAEPR